MFAFSTPDITAAAKSIVAALDKQTAAIDRLNSTLVSIGNQMSQDVQDLVAEVAAVKTVQGSALTLIQGFIAKIDASKDDPAAIQQAIHDLKDGTQPLADAVAANTPAANP